MYDPGFEDFIISITSKTDLKRKPINRFIIMKYKLFCIKLYVSKTRRETYVYLADRSFVYINKNLKIFLN